MANNQSTQISVDIQSLPWVPLESRNLLPRCSAVYFAVTRLGTVLYIGQAVDIKQRWGRQYKRFSLLAPSFICVAWMEVDRKDLHAVEKTLIEQFRPPMNWIGAVTANARAGGQPDPEITQRRLRRIGQLDC